MGAHEFGLDQETVTGFLDEAGKHIETLNERLLAIEQGKIGQEVSQQVVAEMFRAAHSLKGAAGFLKLTDIAGVTHRMESVLDNVRHGKLTFTNQVVEALFRSFDVVSSLLAEVGGGAAGHVDTAPVMALLNAALGGQPPTSAAVAAPAPVIAPAPTPVPAPATSDDPSEQHLGRLPDWLRGRLTEDDVCEALFASGDGAKSVALRFDTADLLQFTKGPVAAMAALNTALRVRRILHLVMGPEELWAPLRDYGLQIGVFAFVAGDVDAILTALDVPHGSAWILQAGGPARELRIGRDPASAVKRHNTLIVKPDSMQHLSLWLSTTRETLAELDAALLDLERAPMESAHVDCVFRHLHSLKGASATMGLDEIARIAHQGENLLAAVRDGRMRLDPDAIASLFATKDAVQTCVDRVEHNETASPDTTALDAALGRHLAGLINERSVLPVWHPNDNEIAAARATSGSKPLWKLRLVLAAQAPLADLRLGMVLNNLSKVAQVALSRPTLAELERGLPDPPPLVALFASSLPLKSLIEAITCDHVRDWSLDPVAVSDEPAAAVVASSSVETRQASAAAVDTVRVDTARLDHLLNTTGELVITKARLSQQVDTLMRLLDSVDLRVLEGLVAQAADLAGGRVTSGIQALRRAQEEVRRTRDTTLDLHRHTGAMQNSVMRARMVPIGPLFQRFHRLVRDLCKERGREAKLITFGEGTELDKKLIDEIGDPLTHLIRNGVDHGLESPDEREAAGKPRCGSVHLEAFHQGGMICIRVRDDGRGLVMEKIRAKAIERGLVTAEAANRMSEAEVYQFIFLPGFSTAAQVTNISGRGVGMDIVKSKITALKGKVEITSEPGHGATFTIALPLTLAMIDSLLVRIGDGRFAFPLDSVREIVEVKPEEVHTVEGKGRVIFLRDQVISLLDLNHVMGICPLTGARDTVRAVITKGGPETLAIAVDQVIGDEEIVVKPLGQEFAFVRGLSGATVLGDGGVALILDIHGIHELTRVKRAPAQAVGV